MQHLPSGLCSSSQHIAGQADHGIDPVHCFHEMNDWSMPRFVGILARRGHFCSGHFCQSLTPLAGLENRTMHSTAMA